ncbi:hypothetical protein LTR36_002965 [Oleoguttula mirabilis]|uniref:Zinc finger PHD-type domain-containing protein n=1 Tax=Oleoguttula mirabilis TaxID=1507867 RepID=A0AAV9JWJ4_9PEZI|nr:hypothetical protein LTR36_002965 [Oleoguttula mirabilis]
MERIDCLTPEGLGMDGTPLPDPTMTGSPQDDEHSGQEAKHPYYHPDDDIEPPGGNNETEDSEKDPWKCICGQLGRQDDDLRAAAYCEACCTWQHCGCLGLPFVAEERQHHHHCHRCVPYDEPQYAGLLAARARGERPWERNMVVFEVLGCLDAKNVEWFGMLYSRLSEGNIAALGEGRKLSGKVKGKVDERYRSDAEAATRMLLQRLGDEEVRTLRERMVAAGADRSKLYNLLREAADGEREGWEGCEGELGVLAELFGWVPKAGKGRSK